MTEWLAYERLFGPIGPERDDTLTALTRMTIYNSRVQKESQAKPITEFLPDWQASTTPDDEEADADGDND